MKKILVTGASGFIGGHCIKLLAKRNFEIHAITRNILEVEDKDNVFWYEIDLFDLEKIEHIFKKVRPSLFLHLAWKMETGLKLDSDENEKWFHLSKKLVKLFYQYGGKRLVVSGSCFEYDLSCEKISESTPLNSNNEYGKNKNKLYQYLASLRSEKNISFGWARIFFTFGPHQKNTSLVPYVISSLIKNEVVETTDGNQKYDYLFVEDIALALVLLLESPYNGAVNISSGKGIRLKDLILMIAKKFNKEELIHFGMRPRPINSPKYVVGNNEKLKNEIGWEAQVDLEKAMEITINYYKKNEQ